MSIGLLSLIILILAVVGYSIGKARAVGQVSGDIRKLHSLPPFYGRITALMTAVPARFSRSPPNVRRLWPALGEHNREILREAGCSEAEIDAIVG